MSTHNLCFGPKIRKVGIQLYTPVLLYKSGVQGVFFSWTCFPDEIERFSSLEHDTCIALQWRTCITDNDFEYR